MKTFFKILFLVLLFLQILSSSEIKLTKKEKEFLNTHPVITFGSDYNWIPYIIKNKNGTISGYDADILKEVNRLTGANFKLQTGKWKDILEDAKNNKIDGLSTSAVHKEREEFFNFSDIYVTTQRLLIVSNLNPKNINSVDDLKGKKIGYQKKNLFEEKLVSRYEESSSIAFETYNEMLDAIIEGKIDAIIGSYPLIYFAQQKGFPFIKIVNKIPNSNLNLVFSIRKDYIEALSILNKGLNNISYENKMKIHSKWFFEKNDNLKLTNKKIDLTKEEKEWLKQNPYIKLAGVSNQAPVVFDDKDRIKKGIVPDYLNVISEMLNTNIFISKNANFSDIHKEAKENHNYGMATIFDTPKTRELYNLSLPYTSIAFSIFTTVDKINTINNPKDLEGKTVVAPKDHYRLQEYLKDKGVNTILVSTPQEQFQKVINGEADALVGYITYEYLLNKLMLTQIKLAYIDNSVENIHIGVNKEHKHLVSILNKAIKNINSETSTEISQKWVSNGKSKTPDTNNNSFLSNEERVYLNQRGVIRMCVLPNWLPFEQINENTKHKGIGADIIEIISEKIDKEFVLVPTKQWSKSLQNIRDRKCDILPVAMDIPSRRDAMNFTKPYVSEPFVIATKNDQFFIRDENQLSNKKIGIVASYAFIEVMKEKNPLIEIIEVKNTKEGLEKVSSGELFGYLDTMPTVGYFIQKYGMVDLKIAGKLDYDITLSIASRNDEPLLNSIMQKTLDTISQEEIRKIVGRWIEIKVQQEFDYRRLFYVVIGFVLIVLLILYRNRTISIINKKLERANSQILQQQSMVDKYVLILTTNLDGVIINVNEAYCNTVGFTKEELVGKKFEMLRHPDMKEEFFKDLWKNISENGSWDGEVKNLSKEKKELYFNVFIESLYNSKGEKIGYRSISEDITDKKRIEELSITDKLTGLNNRLKIDELLVKYMDINKRYGTSFSVILLDIDNFKKVNDTFGHDVGDYVLQEIAKILKSVVRKTDEVGRWGGEEFIVICSNSNEKESFTVAEHIRQTIEEFPFNKVGKQTVSLGLSQYEQTDTISSLFKRVDICLYQAKREGKNKTVKYNS